MAALLKERTDIKNKNKIIEEIKILQATIIPPEMSPDGHNLLQRMNWLISQVGENSGAPTQAQWKWINILSEEAGNTLTQWKVLKDRIIREN